MKKVTTPPARLAALLLTGIAALPLLVPSFATRVSGAEPPEATTPASAAPEDEELEFETLMGFEYEQGKPLPDNIKKYDGKEIVIKGYMDTYTQENSREFYLMSASCACDGEVKLNHFIDVRLDDQVVGYRPGLITVRGKFIVKEVEEDGFIVSLFQIEGRIE